MASKPIRVIAAGNAKTEPLSKILIEGLKPEVEVIHFALSDHIEDDLPSILQEPKNKAQAQALLLGGAYTDEALDKLRVALGSDIKMPWVKIDPSKSKFSPKTETAAYIDDAIVRFKGTLLRLEGNGKLGLDGVGSDGSGEIYLV